MNGPITRPSSSSLLISFKASDGFSNAEVWFFEDRHVGNGTDGIRKP